MDIEERNPAVALLEVTDLVTRIPLEGGGAVAAVRRHLLFHSSR